MVMADPASLRRRLLDTGIDLSATEAGGALGRMSVPEPIVKEVLAELGITVPRGRSVPAGKPPAADGLTGPVVLKAWGPGLLHKSDVGAVRLGDRKSVV